MFESQHQKLLKMHAWDHSPFQGWEPVKVCATTTDAVPRWKLRREPGPCVRCNTKRSNRHCTAHACKPCCLMLGGCVTHRRAVATSPLGSGGSGGSGSGGGGGAALARRNLPRCHSCGCHNCKGTRRACNAAASVMQDWKDAHLGAIPKNLRSSKVKVCVRCKAVCWMVPLLAVVPVEPAVHDDAAVSAALVSQGAGDEFTSDDDASGESE